MKVPLAQLVALWLLAGAVAANVSGQCTNFAVDIYEGPSCSLFPSWAGDARAINNHGDITMAYTDCGGKVNHYIIWFADGSVVGIPSSGDGGYPSPPLAINDDAMVAGNLKILPSVLAHAFVSAKGTTTNLGELPGDSTSEAYGISKDGKVVGFSSGCTSTCRIHAVLWQDGTATALELPMGPSRIAYGISESGEYICGWMGIDPSPHFGSHAFRWNDGDVIDLGTLPGTTSSEARSVNNVGEVCGIAYAPVGKFEMIRHGFLWSDGQMQEIGYLPGYTQTLALDLNDFGQVIGRCNFDSGAGEPFVWKGGKLAALNDLVPPELNLNFQNAWSINNAGQIAAQATRPGPNGTENVAVRLTPIPSPIGDSDCDNDIDVDDLLKVINSWGAQSPKGSNALPPADFNHDSVVSLPDLLIVIDNWTL